MDWGGGPRMKILWVKTDFLYPPSSGGQIRTLEILKRLHQRHEIHYAALDLPQPGAGLRRTSEYCARAYAIPHPVPPKVGPHHWVELAAAVCAKTPLSIQRYRSGGLLRQVEILTRREKFDAIVCDFLASAANIPELDRAVLFQHNVESMIWKRHAEHARTPWHRAYCRAQHERMLRYEGEVSRRVKRVIAVSDSDAIALRSLYGARSVCPVPTGVDVDYFTPPAHNQAETKTDDLVFTGAMDWRPNIDAMNWFTTEVLPLIRCRRPGCSLAIVGRRPIAEIRKLAERDALIRVTGTVEDVRPYLWQSALSIVPLRIGGGTRLKIYESMAAKVPVVSTQVGAEGLDIRDGENIALADAPAEFADRCLALLAAADARARMAANAWQMVAACYSWEVVSRQFEKLLE